MKHLTAAKTLLVAGTALLATTVFGQAAPDNGGYVMFGNGTPDANIWRSGSYGGKAGYEDKLCWRTSDWTPAKAVAGCDPDLVKAPEPVAEVAPPPAPEPVVAVPVAPVIPAAPAVRKITLDSQVLFEFNKAELRPEGKEAINRELVSQLPNMSAVSLVLISGHADRIGSDAYNQRLSEKRAESVRAFLAENGVPADKIESLGLGETQPVTGDSCQQKNRAELIKCLAPDRRVDIEINGEVTE